MNNSLDTISQESSDSIISENNNNSELIKLLGIINIIWFIFSVWLIWIIWNLILYVVKKEEMTDYEISAFLHYFNFIGSLILYSMISWLLCIIIWLILIPILGIYSVIFSIICIIIWFILILILCIYSVIFSIIGFVYNIKGQAYEYPFVIDIFNVSKIN